MRALLLMSLALTSCAYQTTKEVQSSGSEDLKPAIRDHLVPGTTYGNVALQGQTIEAVKDVLVANTTFLNCSADQMKVYDTWPLGNPTPSEHSNAFLRWEELWTFEACGRSVDAEVVYMLHRRSGIVNVKVSPVKEGDAVDLASIS